MEALIALQRQSIQELKEIRRRVSQENKVSRTVEKAAKWKDFVEAKWKEIADRNETIMQDEKANVTRYVSETDFVKAVETYSAIKKALEEWKVEPGSGGPKQVRGSVADRTIKLGVLSEVIGRFTTLFNGGKLPSAEFGNVESIIEMVTKLLNEFLTADRVVRAI